MARPTKFKEEYVEQAEKLIALGLSQRDLAVFFGVDEDTIWRWKKRHKDFAEAIKRGEMSRKMGLLRKMWEMAKAGNTSVVIFLAKNWLGMTDKQETLTDQTIKIKVVDAKNIRRGKNG